MGTDKSPHLVRVVRHHPSFTFTHPTCSCVHMCYTPRPDCCKCTPANMQQARHWMTHKARTWQELGLRNAQVPRRCLASAPHMFRASCSLRALESGLMSLTLSVTSTLSSVTRSHWYSAAAHDSLMGCSNKGGGGEGRIDVGRLTLQRLYTGCLVCWHTPPSTTCATCCLPPIPAPCTAITMRQTKCDRHPLKW